MKKSTYSTYSTTSSTPWLKWSVAVVIFGAFIGLIYMATANKDSLTSEDDLEVVSPLSGPVKVRAEDSGGMEVANRDKQVFDLLEGSEVEEVSHEDLCNSEDGAMVCNKELPKVTKLEPTPLSDDATKMMGNYGKPSADIAGLITSIEKEETKVEEVAPQAVAKVVTEKKEEVKPLVQPIQKPVKLETKKEVSANSAMNVSEVKKEVEKAVEKKVVPAKPKTDLVAKEKVFTSGAWGVQLASYKSLESADKGAKIFTKRYASLLNDLTYVTEKIEIKGKGTFYRVQFIGLTDKSAAKKRCDAIKAKGQGCWYVNK